MLLTQAYKDNWSAGSKLFFRFIFSYFLLYIFFLFANGLFEVPFKWIGKNLVGVSYNYDVSGYGSGDNTYAYITLFVNFILAVIITVVWSIIQKYRKSYNKAFYWFLVVLRSFMVAAMFLYGFVKVFQIQFQQPSFVKLLQPLGEYSPMGLAWAYMGYSKGFGMFAGIMEILGGVLLIWRRTSTLGAFIVMGVMIQVAMMNLMFDIPVKLFSIHLVAMATILFMTDIKRFSSVFLTNKSTEAYSYYHPITFKSYHKTIIVLKKILLPIILVTGTILSYLGHLNISNKNHRPKFYGIWKTKTFLRNNDTISPLITDHTRWNYLLIERKDRAFVKTMTDEILIYTFMTDSIKNRISVYIEDGAKDSLNFKYKAENSKVLKLNGKLENDSLSITFTKIELEEFPLMSRGFHWINERPFN